MSVSVSSASSASFVVGGVDPACAPAVWADPCRDPQAGSGASDGLAPCPWAAGGQTMSEGLAPCPWGVGGSEA